MVRAGRARVQRAEGRVISLNTGINNLSRVEPRHRARVNASDVQLRKRVSSAKRLEQIRTQGVEAMNKYCVAMLCGVSTFALGSAAFAQQAAQVEEVIVTGSRVVANGNQAPTPVTVVP